MIACSALFTSVVLLFPQYKNIAKPAYDCPRSMLGGCTGPAFYDTGAVSFEDNTELSITFVSLQDKRSMQIFIMHPAAKAQGDCIDPAGEVYRLFTQITELEMNPKI